MEYKMLTERRSEEAKKIRRQMMKQGKDWSPRRAKILVPRTDGLVQALQTGLTKDHYVLAIPKSTNTQSKYMKNNSQELKTMATSPKSTQKNYQTLTASSVASLVRHLASQENDGDSMIPEVRSFLTSHGFLGRNNHAILSLRTLKGFYLTTKETRSAPSSPRLMNWGTTVNGVCLTAKTSVSHKTGSGSTLSDILEEHPDPKYFLSKATTEKLLMKSPLKDSSSTSPDESQTATESEKTAEQER